MSASVTVDSPVGRLTLTERDGALVSLVWGESAGSDETPLLRSVTQHLAAYFEGDLKMFELPLAPDGTAFQKRVYRAMQAIPFGKTRSYGELATDLASAARAVGGACGSNPIPIVIPCHRVVAASGRLGGFSGGRGGPTKTWLLRHEGVSVAPQLSLL
ncbi:methylated-DNA--[protein]-cysteine S-methyltransferase [Algihabitans albus]|uniref:methylated-DNA--[protein]-cysteine S-methyltransferase n=1 Tax=Algihabitans albus TaxID=2164067 RepID=UPI000E5C6B41|nr:methylated-DNA--[protein]-cysteine S-methyltransferase [Algihabitans albus]